MSVRQALIIGGSRGIGFYVALKFAVFFKLLFIYNLTFGQFFDNSKYFDFFFEFRIYLMII